LSIRRRNVFDRTLVVRRVCTPGPTIAKAIHMRRDLHVLLLSVTAVLCACASQSKPAPESQSSVAPPPPMTDVANAYEAAVRVELPKVAATESSGLHNVYRLSPNIVSGSEPHGEEAMAEIARMGVKAILSVDGSTPDAATAAKYGIRYVHVPIEYRGISDAEVLQIAKTFREVEGPFYVHCFHGKHRGPAAAAIGRIVLDGAPRERALAEMRQWCGTAPSYEGLYATIAKQTLPDEAATQSFAFDFPSAQRPEGLASQMVAMSRPHDHLVDLAKRDWRLDPTHPDIDAVNESKKMLDALEAMLTGDDYRDGPADFRGWTDDSVAQARKLHAFLVDVKAGTTAAATPAKKSLTTVMNLCKKCHDAYRN
jgi:protein tyrosine phosphatase (PTP) superfamily phosphohydrolase (DUF442 family)